MSETSDNRFADWAKQYMATHESRLPPDVAVRANAIVSMLRSAYEAGRQGVSDCERCDEYRYEWEMACERERARALDVERLTRERAVMLDALNGIAFSTCCEGCNEAKRWAKAALEKLEGVKP